MRPLALYYILLCFVVHAQRSACMSAIFHTGLQCMCTYVIHQYIFKAMPQVSRYVPDSETITACLTNIFCNIVCGNC